MTSLYIKPKSSSLKIHSLCILPLIDWRKCCLCCVHYKQTHPKNPHQGSVPSLENKQMNTSNELKINTFPFTCLKYIINLNMIECLSSLMTKYTDYCRILNKSGSRWVCAWNWWLTIWELLPGVSEHVPLQNILTGSEGVQWHIHANTKCINVQKITVWQLFNCCIDRMVS